MEDSSSGGGGRGGKHKQGMQYVPVSKDNSEKTSGNNHLSKNHGGGSRDQNGEGLTYQVKGSQGGQQQQYRPVS